MKDLSTLCHPGGVEAPLPLLKRLAARLSRVHTLMTATLREIFDESAYQRFLIRHDLHASAKTYAAFWSEHEAVKTRRPRCC